MSHQLSNIHPKAKIGKNVVIEYFVTIHADVEIGDNTWIGPNAVIMDGARIGKNCKIHSGAVISGVPQDLKYKGEKTLAIIGNNTEIREFTTINKGTVHSMKTKIGNNCLIMAYTHIAHDVFIEDNVVISVGVSVAGHCNIGKFAVIEGLCGIQQFVRIGTYSFIAGNSMIRKDVPPYVKCARNPSTYKGINSIGLKRRGWDELDIKEIESIYKIIYIQNTTILKGIEQGYKKFSNSKYITQIIDFIKKSKNGVIKRYK